MTQDEIIKIFKENSALLQGHFLLSSGLHSDKYFQCALIFENPKTGEMFSSQLAELFKDKKIDIVIGPALGGVILAYEVAKHLNARAMFAERENGIMNLRRGFQILKGESVLVVEDVLTTGKSTREVIEVVNAHEGKVIGIGSLIDRSGGSFILSEVPSLSRGEVEGRPATTIEDLPIAPKSLLKITANNYPAENCPLCRAKIPFIKPGSR